MSESGGLILSESMGEFFRTEITEARDELGMCFNESVEHYLVNLLCDYIQRGERPLPQDEPLAFLYKRAIEAPEVLEQIQFMRDLGDVALYSAGFFGESIEKSSVDRNYYVSMGGAAYQTVAGLIGGKRQGGSFASMYQSLGNGFSELVKLLNHLEEAQLARSRSHNDLLKLYARWLKTRRPRLYNLLLGSGFVNSFTPPDENLQ